MPPLSVLIKPASSSCNLCCTYCFYADEAQARSIPNYGMMSDCVAKTLIQKSLAAAEGAISFLFQGGEPTLAGLDFYRRFVSMTEQSAPKGLSVHYAIQTNGTLLNEAWCAFFAEKHFLVGLSLDGDRECHNRFRRDSTGKGSYNQVVTAARQLEQAGVDYNVLTVVTDYLARHIQRVFSAFCKAGFRFQQYIPCLDPLEEVRGSQKYSLSPARYEMFLKQLFDLWYNELERGRYYSIRYFDNLVWMLAGHPPEQCSMRGVCGQQYLIEADGSVYPCDFYGLDSYRLGNVLENTWEELDQTRKKLGFVEESCSVPETCKRCRWYPLCRNGCRRDRLWEDGILGRNYYCEAYSGFFSYALPRLRQVGDLLNRN